MRTAFATIAFLLSAVAGAHPGHGAPAYLHVHWSVFIGAGPVFLGFFIAARACRTAIRRIRSR